MKFFIGTTNSEKVREIREILSFLGYEFEMREPLSLPAMLTQDFKLNAQLKAATYARHMGGITISEHSGLIVPSLNGLPGPWSSQFSYHQAMFAGQKPPADLTRVLLDRCNNKEVLRLMRDIEQPRRAAMFKAVLVVAAPDGSVLFTGVGRSYGWVSQEERGTHGFGYDSIFIGDNTFGKTYAEISPERKNMISHRRQVLVEFQAWLASRLLHGF